jgi:hypothetical protein
MRISMAVVDILTSRIGLEQSRKRQGVPVAFRVD